jgi:hypothetical protein
LVSGVFSTDNADRRDLDTTIPGLYAISKNVTPNAPSFLNYGLCLNFKRGVNTVEIAIGTSPNGILGVRSMSADGLWGEWIQK